ncbi:MAG: dihydropteroate synthase [Blastocatellia bacterium]
MRKSFNLQLSNGAMLKLGESTIVVGVLNVTPDSFSDGGQHFDSLRAIEHGLGMESDGADIIEIGGESTRPGAPALSADEELARVSPVLKALGKRLRIPVAIDTYKSEVARVALDLGASIINDVSALRFDARIADVAVRGAALLVLMHMRGEPQTMQKIEPSLDIFGDIESDFNTAIGEAESRGVQRERIILDPGIGFGKTLEQNLSILNHLHRFEKLGMPLMIGTSRKSFIGRLTGRPESDRVFGTAASVALAISRGAHMIRVHDVKEMSEVARIADRILAAD